MMAQNQILISVTELLSKKQFVQIENLGSFFMKEMDAQFNPFTHEVKPRHTQIVFNSELAQNDGVLAQYLMSQFGLSFKEANALISDWVSTTKSRLKEKKYLSFHPLGNFFYNETTGLFFVGRSQANLHPNNFGLKPLIWDPKIHHKLDSSHSSASKDSSIETLKMEESQIEDAELIDVTQNEFGNQELDAKTKHSLVWNIAASFAAFAIGSTVLYFGARTLFHGKNENQNATFAPSTDYSADSETNSNHQSSSQPSEQDLAENPSPEKIKSDQSNSTINQNKGEVELTKSDRSANSFNTTSNKNGNSAIPDLKTASKENNNRTKSRYIMVGGRVIEIKSKLTEKKNGSDADSILSSDEYRAEIVSQKGNYYVVGGSYLTENAAKIEIRKWNNLKKEATYFHVSESSLIKIVLKRFKSQKEATEFAVSIKDIPAQSISVQELKLIK